MTDESEERYWTDSYDALYSNENRTLSLVNNTSTAYNNFKNIPNNNIFVELEKKLETGDVTIDNLFDYLRKHPDMLKFSFDDEKKMKEIKVERSTKLTFLNDSIKRLCNMSYYISEMLKILILKSSPEWQSAGGVNVVMSSDNADYCTNKGHNNPLTTISDMPLHAGGSKSRRRHRHRRKLVRKTRRGHGRTHKSKSKSMSKPKTHRRRRHSHVRVRKHKKYTRKH